MGDSRGDIWALMDINIYINGPICGGIKVSLYIMAFGQLTSEEVLQKFYSGCLLTCYRHLLVFDGKVLQEIVHHFHHFLQHLLHPLCVYEKMTAAFLLQGQGLVTGMTILLLTYAAQHDMLCCRRPPAYAYCPHPILNYHPYFITEYALGNRKVQRKSFQYASSQSGLGNQMSVDIVWTKFEHIRSLEGYSPTLSSITRLSPVLSDFLRHFFHFLQHFPNFSGIFMYLTRLNSTGNTIYAYLESNNFTVKDLILTV